MGDGRTVAVVSSEKRKHIHLLLPAALDRRVREMAERERRPLVAQIQLLIERALEGELVA